MPSSKCGVENHQPCDDQPRDEGYPRGKTETPDDFENRADQQITRPGKQVCSPTPAKLTDREGELLQWVAPLVDNQEIAERLVIRKAAVRTLIGDILSKLHLANQLQAALYALRKGISSLEKPKDVE